MELVPKFHAKLGLCHSLAILLAVCSTVCDLSFESVNELDIVQPV